MNIKRTYIDLRWFTAFGSACCGGLVTIVALGVARPDMFVPRLQEDNLVSNYSDFISLTLTALSVILAALAVIIGIFAIWGYSQIQKSVLQKTEELWKSSLGVPSRMITLTLGGLRFSWQDRS